MHKFSVALVGLALVGALAIAGVASGATPKPLGNYCGKYDCLQVNKPPTSINQFHGRCTDVRKPKFTFAVVFPIPINGKASSPGTRRTPSTLPTAAPSARRTW